MAPQISILSILRLIERSGGIELSLCVAKETDRGNKALRWVREGKPQDVSEHSFETVDKMTDHCRMTERPYTDHERESTSSFI